MGNKGVPDRRGKTTEVESRERDIVDFISRVSARENKSTTYDQLHERFGGVLSPISLRRQMMSLVEQQRVRKMGKTRNIQFRPISKEDFPMVHD